MNEYYASFSIGDTIFDTICGPLGAILYFYLQGPFCHLKLGCFVIIYNLFECATAYLRNYFG